MRWFRSSALSINRGALAPPNIERELEMFIVTCNTGYNLFFLSNHGWSSVRENAITFSTRSAANVARRRSYKTNKDHTAILAI